MLKPVLKKKKSILRRLKLCHVSIFVYVHGTDQPEWTAIDEI
jgi:hypothetical protein